MYCKAHKIQNLCFLDIRKIDLTLKNIEMPSLCAGADLFYRSCKITGR